MGDISEKAELTHAQRAALRRIRVGCWLLLVLSAIVILLAIRSAMTNCPNLGLILVAGIAAVILSMYVGSMRCPRCNERFVGDIFLEKNYPWRMIFGGLNCRNCGLSVREGERTSPPYGSS